MENRAHLNIVNGRLHFSNVDVTNLANKYGTPVYILSHDLIRERCLELKSDFLKKYPNVMAVYAGKAFSSISMCKIVEREGLGLDVVSGGELYTAIEASFPMKKIIFHGNNKSYSELVMAIDNGVGRIVVDNLYELVTLNKIAISRGKIANIYYRITPGVDADTHSYISTGQRDSKFGIPIIDKIVYKAVEQALELNGINFMGFHFHVGSQLKDNSSHLVAIDEVIDIIKKVKSDYDYIIKELNIGGGFGISYESNSKTKGISHFLDEAMNTINRGFKDMDIERPKIIIEPGRWLVGDAGITAYTVGSIKEIPKTRKYLAVDGGMTDNLRPALYQAKYEATIANKANELARDLVTIVGKCCESGDILIKDIHIPLATPGDILTVYNTGAYGYSMSNNYNKHTKPPVVLISQGRDNIIIERESYSDLIRLDRVPSFLE